MRGESIVVSEPDALVRIVVAAVLAYPMRTVFNYAGPAGAPCQPASCGLSTGGKAP